MDVQCHTDPADPFLQGPHLQSPIGSPQRRSRPLAIMPFCTALFGRADGFFYGVQLDMTVGTVLLQPIARRR